jgi:putative peptide zinc metalloprotease protein
MDKLRRLALLFAAAVASVTFALGVPAAHADDIPTGGNDAIAINTTDGASIFKFAFAIKHVVGDVVDETNTAVAYSSCNSCSTTAIAIEILLVEGSPSTFTPQNVAVAVNYQCNLCNTFAAAYQFVVQSSGPVHFTPDGRKELHDIRKEIRRLEREHLTPFELAARLEPLIARLKKVLQTELVPDKRHDRPDENDDEDKSNTGTVPQHQGDTTQTDTTPTEATATVPTTSTDTTTTDTTTTTTTTTPTTTGATTTTTP